VTFIHRFILAIAASFAAALLTGSSLLSGQTSPSTASDGWVSLLNGRNFNGWPADAADHYHPDVKETFMQFRNIWIRPLP
jgi:hypothetical protein